VIHHVRTCRRGTEWLFIAWDHESSWLFGALLPSDEFGLQVGLPQTFGFNHMPDCRFHRDAGVTHLRRSHETFSWKEGLVALPGSLL
jgi:hypothetical protein